MLDLAMQRGRTLVPIQEIAGRQGIPQRYLEQVLLALTGAATAWLLIAPLPRVLRARDDRRRGQLHGSRIRVARLATLACVGATIAWMGIDGAFHLSCASAALLAAGLGGARLPAVRGEAASDDPAVATAR
jgi:hypothetical protein